MKQKGFDHLIGGEDNQLSEPEIKAYQKIIKSHSNEQSIEDKRLIERIHYSLTSNKINLKN